MEIKTLSLKIQTRGFNDIVDITDEVQVDFDNRSRSRNIIVQIAGK